MVKKLFKHEIAYYLRSMLPIYGILLVIAAAARILQCFEANNTLYSALNTVSILTYVVGIVAVFVMSTVFTITRYYRNLFTSEGYLSFTLPITPSQHILTKLVCAVLTHIVSLIVVLLSACIITIGDVFAEVCKAISYLIDKAPDLFARLFRTTTATDWQVNGWLFFVECILVLIAILLYEMLLFYGCITVGQMFHKNRILAAVGVYFGYYIATQAIGTILVIVAQHLPWGLLGEMYYNAPIGCTHFLLIGYAMLNLLIATALFFVSRYIIRHKLNLE